MDSLDTLTTVAVMGILAMYFWEVTRPGPITTQRDILHPREGRVTAWWVRQCRNDTEIAEQVIWKTGETLRDELERRQREEMGA